MAIAGTPIYTFHYKRTRYHTVLVIKNGTILTIINVTKQCNVRLTNKVYLTTTTNLIQIYEFSKLRVIIY